MKLYTAAVCLSAQRYKVICFHRRIVQLWRVNRYAVACHICKIVSPAGRLVWQKMYGATGYICFDCLKRLIALADRGYNVDRFNRLVVSLYFPGQYTAAQVAAALRVFLKHRDTHGQRVLIPSYKP